MKKSYSLNSEKKEILIQVYPEDPIVKISKGNVNILDEENQSGTKITFTIFKKRVPGKEEVSIEVGNDNEWPIEYNDSSIDKILVQLDETGSNITSINLEIQKGADLINVSDPIAEFNEHLSNSSNTRILFSAPFGQGKTTFLDIFFTLKEEEYEVFKVFPVNYSVANNDDIFRYIKTDILFQLLEKDIEWEKVKISWSQAISEYLFLNPKKVIANFFKMISLMDKKTNSIVPLLNNFESLLSEIKTYKKKSETDDKKTVGSYIEELYEKEGSLFEDNLYTQLIRQSLECLQEKSNNTKESVLIIEDLDRMDPDHIFRILNVISAHYDAYQNASYSESSNKFGFDKIIVVCDRQNIKNIFHHKYGYKTDFNGYFDKYFSSTPFFFNNKLNVKTHLRDKYFNDPENATRDPFSKAHNVILEALFMADIVNHREVSKITREDFQSFRAQNNSQFSSYTGHFRQGLFYKSISFLSFTMGNSRLEEALKKLTTINIDTKRQFDYYTKCLIPMLHDYKTTFSRDDSSFIIEYNTTHGFYFLKSADEDTLMKKQFYHTDFYKYLLLAFEEYKSLFAL